MICLEHLTQGLETVFAGIQRERMADVPILNPALEVQAVGFREWEACCLGVLITPWFMNLMLLSADGDEGGERPPGTKISHVFPSGSYEFIVGEEDGIGRYQMCSLFSPVVEFQNQQAAVMTAEAVMDGLMDETGRDDGSTPERSIEKIRRGEDGAAEADLVAGGKIENQPSLEERIGKPLSRRELLRGAFFGRRNGLARE